MKRGFNQEYAEQKVKKLCQEMGYSYEPFQYKKAINSILYLTCNKDGYKWKTTFNNFINSKHGCHKCGIIKRSIKQRIPSDKAEQMINKRCLEMGYELEKTYIHENNKSRVYLKCLKDNHTWNTTYSHFVHSKTGCPKCAKNIQMITTEESNKAILKICNELDITLLTPFVYEHSKSEIHLRCNKDNYEWYVPYIFFITRKSGCKKCTGTLKITQNEADQFVKYRCDEMGYEYTPFVYKNAHTKIHLKCLLDFHEWDVIYDSFVRMKTGCPICNESKLEQEVKSFLNKNNINFERLKRFDWLKKKNPLELDFFLPKHNIGIECQGEQHFRPVDFSGKCNECGGREFMKIKQRDKFKFNICQENGVKLLYYAKESNYLPKKYHSEIFTNTDELLKEIKNTKK